MASKAPRSESVLTPEFRVMFSYVWEGRERNGKLKYDLLAAFAPDADLAELKKAHGDLVQVVYPKGKPEWSKSPFKEPSAKQLAKWDGIEKDMVLINMSTQHRPKIMDQKKREIIEPDRFYSGCYARAVCHFYSYNKDGNEGISCGLDGLQLIRDGEHLRGEHPSAMFDAVEMPAVATPDVDDMF